jgi:hypothetical protein
MGLFLSDMKTKLKLELLLNEHVTAAYQAWQAGQAGKLVRPTALPRFVTFVTKGRSL